MRKINRKFIITFLGVLLLSIICFSGITMMFADERNGAGDFATSTDASFGNSVQSNISGAATPTTTPSSIIDWIINFSNSTDATIDNEYHIVEIYSGSTPSALSTMVNKDGVFEKLVLDGHKSEGFTPDFKPGNITYDSYPNDVVAGSSDEADLIAAIEGADLVYLSEDPDEEWDANNDITQAVMDKLADFSVEKSRPLIIDSHNLTQKIKLLGNKKIKDVINNAYAKEGPSYNTFPFDSSKDIETVMNTANVSANYKALDGDVQQAGLPTNPDFGWNKVTYTEVKTKDDPSTDDVDETETEEHTEYVARILTIYNSDESSNLTLTNKILACCDGDYSFTYTDAETEGTDTKNKTVSVKGTFTADGVVKNLKDDSDFYKFAYYGRNARPDAIKFEALDIKDAANLTALNTTDFLQYDFIIFEDTTKEVDISEVSGLYDKLINDMKTGVHILYDASIASNSNNNNSIAILEAPVVKELYNKVAYENDTGMYDNVLVTAREYMRVYSESTNAASVDDIANIINGGTFRTIGNHSSGGSSNKYTVLEIEPCYPINMDLAKALLPVKDFTYQVRKFGSTTLENKKFRDGSQIDGIKTPEEGKSYYYIRTDKVRFDTTSDEISYDDTRSLTTLLENAADLSSTIKQSNSNLITDYYNWSISKAKICHATGRDWNEVEVKHMSSIQFACSRVSLLDNYDAIYIGGDNSSIKKEEDWYTKALGGKVYNMYFHNGDMYNYTGRGSGFNDTVGQYGVLGGNDLTENSYKELLDYSKKMPVILSLELCNAYKGVFDDPNQTLIDPESRMFKYLKDVAEIKNGVVTSKFENTVLVNFDHKYTYKANNAKNPTTNIAPYGPTYGGYATVFHGISDTPDDAFNPTKAKEDYDSTKVGEKELKKILSKSRPQLYVLSDPNPTNYGYVLENRSTWIDPDSASYKSKGLEWTVQVSEDATINIYIDDDSDGRFAASELMVHKNAKKDVSTTLNFKPTSDYYGVVYWKIEAVAKSGLKASVTGVGKIKRTTQTKMYVNLLQIMPTGSEAKYYTNGQHEESLRTLFLCTECQFAKSVLRGNRYTSEGVYYQGVLGGQNTFLNSDVSVLSSTASVEEALKKFKKGYEYKGYNNGSHTHDFGIVKYDSALTGTPDTDADHTGIDEIESNWFDDIREDYDVDTTIIYCDDYEDKIANVKAAFSGLNKTKVNAKITGSGGYKEEYNRYNKYYLAMKAIINGTVEGYTDQNGHSICYT